MTFVAPGFVETELQGHNVNPVVKQATERSARADRRGARAGRHRGAILYAVTRPAQVGLNEVVVRPTKQAR